MTLAKDVEHGKLIKKIFKVDRPIAEDPNDDTSPLIFTITTDVRDREGDVVQPTGIMVENYRQNAVMQWAHKYDELPIGKSVEMWAQKIKSVSKDGNEVEQDGIKAAVLFQPDDNYHNSYSGLRGSMVRRMYQTGFLNAVSIGFDPYQWDEIEEKDEDRTESAGLWGNGTNFTKWDLLEFSAVPVPANPQAVMDRAATFGHDKDMVKAFLKEMSDFCTDDRCEKERRKELGYDITTRRESTGGEEKNMTENKIETLTKRIAELEAQVKAGRVLSSKNESDLRKADSLTDQCGELIEGVLEQATGKPVVEPADEGSDVAPAAVAPKGIPRQVTIKYPLGHEAPEVIEVHEPEPISAEPETEIVESDDDIIVVDEDDLLRVINDISDDDELPDEIESELSLSQRETGETETEV